MVGIDDIPADHDLHADLHMNPAGPAVPEVPALPAAQQQQVLLPREDLPRVRRTHKDEFISSLLSKLSLREKLSKNKEIEDLNKARELKKLNHYMDPELYPETGSDNASFITIDDEDLRDLKDPSVLARFSNFIPDFLLLRITREIRADKDEREKRKLDENSSHSLEISLDSKRRRMDGSKAAERIVGAQRDIEFSDILFTTNLHVPIPLPFFRNENLRYIIDQAATLPTVKSNPLAGEAKGQFILNISDMTRGAKGCKSFGEELSLDFGEWSEAAQNCFRFHQMQDKDGDMGAYASWWSSHFNFFNSQEDKITQYGAWKDLELKLRREYRTEATKFDISHYAMKYEAAKMAYEIKQLMEKQYTTSASMSSKDAPPRTFKDGFRPSSGGRGGKNSSDSHQPFPQGSKPRHPACCILCGELDHTLSKHYGDGNTPTKFADGKPTWAKASNNTICTPNGKEICINFCLRGPNATCSHADGGKAHVCSFCGSKTHHAFAWICRIRPTKTSDGN